MKKMLVLVATVAVVAVGCGSTSESSEPVIQAAQTVTTTTVAPTTTAPATTTTTTTLPDTTTTSLASDEVKTFRVIPGEDSEVDAIVEAYSVVFDSTTTFDEKAVFLADASGLEETIVKYAAAGDDVGGITLQADRVGIDGADAVVIYSFLFAGNATYSDLEGVAVLTDAGWQIPRDFFCQIMVLSRVGCP